jgi:adenosylhomocysteine nucleosidase
MDLYLPELAAAARSPSPPAILFALRYEAAPFLRMLRLVARHDDAPCEVATYTDGRSTIVVAIAGMGADRATCALGWLCDRMRPSMVVSAGFAGGLSPRLWAGNVLLATEIVRPPNGLWRCAQLVTSAGKRTGRLLDVPSVVSAAAEKAELGKRYHADAADMESAAIAEFCEGDGLPFIALRAVSDPASLSLPPAISRLIDGDTVQVQRLAWTLLRRPWLLIPVVRLWRNSRLAAGKLAQHLRILLHEHPWKLPVSI